jgi:hypothetical protein
MESIIPDIIGTIGVMIVLFLYFMLQTALIRVEQLIYSVLNAVGALMILYSLYYHWNFASVVIEISWLLISFYGIFKNFWRSNNNTSS